MTDMIQRDIGKHDAQIEALQKELHELRETLKDVSGKLGTINDTISDFKGRYRGGVWVIGAVASAGGILGAGVTWLMGVIHSLPGMR
jgi:hypothetical protein